MHVHPQVIQAEEKAKKKRNKFLLILTIKILILILISTIKENTIAAIKNNSKPINNDAKPQISQWKMNEKPKICEL